LEESSSLERNFQDLKDWNGKLEERMKILEDLVRKKGEENPLTVTVNKEDNR
jgi:hypothetical protein